MKKIIKNISIIFQILLNKIILRRPDFSEKKIFLQGQLLDNINRQKTKISNFGDVEFSVFSQFGEDGIISWLTDKVPNIKKVFVEIGTQDYWEANTRYLIKSKKWKGYLIEGSKDDVKKIKRQRIYWQNDLRIIDAFINKDNINHIVENNIKETNIGLLSIDIDGNDYWVLENINNLSPTFIVCEYNSIFGDIFKVSIPYDQEFIRNKSHHSNLYFGASLNAFICMLDNKGYNFLGTGSAGVNAFFVKKEFFSIFKSNIGSIKSFPSTARECRDKNGMLAHENLLTALHKIKEMKVFDFDENRNKKIKDYKQLYTDNWMSYFK
jgi:hypothetical protein